jgi:hypothetical protein
LFIHGHRFTFKHLCLQSITKILRNGPRAHFPFSRDFTFLREVSSQLPPYITYNFFWRSLSSLESESPVRMSLRTCSGGLIPEVPFSRDRVTFVDLLLARPATRRRAILGGLLALLADALRKLEDLSAFRGAVATVGMDRA